MKIMGEEILLEDIQTQTHIDLDTAIRLALYYVSAKNELSEDIYNQIAAKLSDDEKQLFVSMLTGKGIRVLPIQPEITKMAEEETDIENIKLEIINATNEKGEITQPKLEKILEKIVNPLIKSRIMEWLISTPQVKIKEMKDAKQTEYEKRIKKKIKKITGSEVFYND